MIDRQKVDDDTYIYREIDRQKVDDDTYTFVGSLLSTAFPTYRGSREGSCFVFRLIFCFRDAGAGERETIVTGLELPGALKQRSCLIPLLYWNFVGPILLAVLPPALALDHKTGPP